VFEYRAATLADAPQMRDLVVRADHHDGVPRVLDLDELIEELTGGAIDLTDGSLLALADGMIVGSLLVSHRRSEIIEQRCYLEGVVDPDFRRRGIGRTLVEFGVDRATAVLRAIDDDLPKFIRLHGYDHIESVHRLAVRMGFAPIRYFDDLLRPLTEIPARGTIEGLQILPWPEGRDEEIRIAKNVAFLDHWGSVPTPQSVWHDLLHGYGGRPDLSFIAVDVVTDQVVAELVTSRYEADDELLGRSDGWIQILGTLREWRGKGVGSALIIEALHAYRAVGLTHASIGVDSENPSGAARLYRNLGFEPEHRIIAHQITL
jgi:GNAT superfamily N-acetyltransferase